MNPVHILIAYFLNSDLNITFQSTTTSPKQHHSFKSSDHILFIFVHPLYTACPGNLILLEVLYFVKTPNFSSVKDRIQVMANYFSDFPPHRIIFIAIKKTSMNYFFLHFTIQEFLCASLQPKEVIASCHFLRYEEVFTITRSASQTQFSYNI